MPTSIIRSFFFSALLWLVPCLAVWYWAREYVILPPGWLAGSAMHYLFAHWVVGTEWSGMDLTLLTSLGIRQSNGQIADLAPDSKVLTYCYGLPLFCALLLASKAKQLWWKIPVGALVMVPFQAWGVCAAWLLSVAVLSGPQTRLTTYFTDFDTNVIALSYQLGFLLFPTLVPMLLWVYLERHFVITVAAEGTMEALTRPPPK